MEFHIARTVREQLDIDDVLFGFSGNVVFANVAASRRLAQRLATLKAANLPDETFNAGALFAMGLIDELSHALVARYRKEVDPQVMTAALSWLSDRLTPPEADRLLLNFVRQFPTVDVYRGKLTPEQWLASSTPDAQGDDRPNREIAFEELLLLHLANKNPAFAPFRILFDDVPLAKQTAYTGATQSLPTFFATRPPVDPKLGTLLDALSAPMLASPDSLTGQLDFISENWSEHIATELRRVLLAIDVLREEELAVWMRFHPAGPDNHRHGPPGRGGEGFVGDEFIGFESEYVTGSDGVRRRRYATDYQAPLNEYEAFSADQAWMPNAVLIAKNTYVWLEQLSKKYQRHIHRLDQIPDEELQILASRGITGLWLIGLWERSRASKTIKRLRGNRDAVASAYSLKDYSIAEDIGGEDACADLRRRAGLAGLRLASDMVPNHMGIDSDWVIDNPDWFISRPESPFPVYSFNGPDLSTDSRVEIKIEDHYYDQSDAAVVFRIRHHREGSTRFMYHGNDGTTFAWNDTAQLDYSKAAVREHVIQVILDVARRFPIIRFDAAMVLAKRHVQRLWFPLPGAGGSIPSRAEDAMSQEQFDAICPNEFWREVVDRVAVEVPGTLLLAEAFWLLESYFVRTLGMHRVYNSAFMNMLRDEENAKYRSYLKKTVEFDPDILKRYVNFMSNPDERTAIDQFGSGDKFFGVSVLLATLPGLPMFGHGQVEGFTERYGMDFKQARMDEWQNEGLIARHQQLIAPLLRDRHIFAESENFIFYDFWTGGGDVDENVFAYSNRSGHQRGIIVYNNRYESTQGTLKTSVGYLEKNSGNFRQKDLAEGLDLPYALDQGDDHGMVLAYRDRVQGLEYLRRARDFRDQGLTLDLHGYQHVVLLDWRELQSTEAYPWDRLCDALNGSGVYSVDDALRQLRVQPLLEALHKVVSVGNIQLFSKAAPATAAAPPDFSRFQQNVDTFREIAATLIPPSDAASSWPNATSSSKLKTQNSKLEAETSKPEAASSELADGELTTGKLGTDSSKPEASHPSAASPSSHTEPSSAETSIPSADSAFSVPEESATTSQSLFAAAIRLPQLTESFPKLLRPATDSVLPSNSVQRPPSRVWAPVLAWLTLRALPSPEYALQVFDELHLRHALAETFSSVGITGEDAWRAAARIRALLELSTRKSTEAALSSADFWYDADVHWLTGITGAGRETDLFDPENFASFLAWATLPQLLETPTASPEQTWQAARQAKYIVSKFLKTLQPPSSADLPDEKSEEALSFAVISEP